jgi:hypothetical protein
MVHFELNKVAFHVSISLSARMFFRIDRFESFLSGLAFCEVSDQGRMRAC